MCLHLQTDPPPLPSYTPATANSSNFLLHHFVLASLLLPGPPRKSFVFSTWLMQAHPSQLSSHVTADGYPLLCPHPTPKLEELSTLWAVVPSLTALTTDLVTHLSCPAKGYVPALGSECLPQDPTTSGTR